MQPFLTLPSLPSFLFQFSQEKEKKRERAARSITLSASVKCSAAGATAPLPELRASDVPAVHVAVSVGSTSWRFVIRAAHLNHPEFRKLLLEAEEEYGFPSAAGAISLPCDVALFEHVLRHVSTATICCHVGHRDCSWHADSLSLLHGIADKAVW